MDKIVDYAGPDRPADHPRPSPLGRRAPGPGLGAVVHARLSREPLDRRLDDAGEPLRRQPDGDRRRPAQRAARPGHLGRRRRANDWRLAAERAGNAILARQPQLADHRRGRRDRAARAPTGGAATCRTRGPSRCGSNVAGRLVYSPHDYPASVYPQPWFSDPNYPTNLPAVWDRELGLPVPPGDRAGPARRVRHQAADHLRRTSGSSKMVAYLGGDLDGNGDVDMPAGQQGPSWTWWSWNPNSGDTGGILQDDWAPSTRQGRPDQADRVPVDGRRRTGADRPVLATFTVTLSVPSGQTVTVNYATSNGTATAGADYTAVERDPGVRPGRDDARRSRVPVLADSAGRVGRDVHRGPEQPAATPPSPTGTAIGTILDAARRPACRSPASAT